MNAYKRLTKQGGLNFANKNLSLADEWGYSHIYNRLAELEDKIEQGTLKEIPENAVVLTREEYEWLTCCFGKFEEIMNDIKKSARKEITDKGVQNGD